MFARIWWKETRQFWPLWVVLPPAAAGLQWLAAWFSSRQHHADAGPLASIGLAVTCLYAIAVSCAAFAGEREARTLTFLDAMPVDRRRLWMGKASFAAVTSVTMGLVGFVIAWLFSQSWSLTWFGPISIAFAAGALFLIECVGWSLFWSALLENVLLTAVLAVLAVAFSNMSSRDLTFSAGLSLSTWPVRLPLALLTFAASAFVFVGTSPPRMLLPTRSRIVKDHLEPGPPARRRKASRTWPRAAIGLLWKTSREVWPVWWKLALLAWVIPFCLSLGLPFTNFAPWFLGVNAMAALIAGICVFGVEGRVRGDRFLANHGAGAGLVWAVKNAVWVPALTFLLVPSLLITPRLRHQGRLESAAIVLVFWAAMLSVFAVGQLAGLTIRRGITAGTVAALVWLLPAVLFAWVFSITNDIVAGLGGMVLFALLALLLCRPWTTGWLVEGQWKWGYRLVALGLFALVQFGSHVAFRVLGVPGVRAEEAARLVPSSALEVSEEGDASLLYQEACEALLLDVRPQEPSIMPDAAYQRQRKIPPSDDIERGLAKVREATEHPGGVGVRLEGANWVWAGKSYKEKEVVSLIALPLGLSGYLESSVRKGRRKGDLDAAWRDIMTMLKMSHQMMGPVPISMAERAQRAERDSIGLAMRWVMDERQTLEGLNQARVEFATFRPRPDEGETICLAALRAERLTELPWDELRELLPIWWPPEIGQSAKATPWERARARRAIRVLALVWLSAADKQPWAVVWPGNVPANQWVPWPDVKLRLIGDAAPFLTSSRLDEINRATPMARAFMPNFRAYLNAQLRNETAKAALETIFALRSWQLKHDGAWPTRLDELVPSELEQLPIDLYSGGLPFGYVEASGQGLLPLGDLEPLELPDSARRMKPTQGMLLYSVGPDGMNQRALRNDETDRIGGDFIFPLIAPEP